MTTLDVPASTGPAAKPRPTSITVEPYRPFPVEELPEPVRGFVAAGAKAMRCDPSYIAMPLLTAIAAAIGNTRRLRLKHSWWAPTILWTAIVGESGTMKTPACRLALRALRERQADALKRQCDAMRQYEIDHARWELEIAKWKKKPEGDAPPKPAEPQPERCLVSDTTVEALAVLLQDNPRGLHLHRDELAGWIGSFDRYAKGGKGGGDSAHWLSMHAGETVIVDRKTPPHKLIVVPRAALCISGGIQPAILRRALGAEHRESGLAARMLLSYPPRTPKRWTEADVDEAAQAEIAAMFDALYTLKMIVGDDDELRPALVGMTRDAKARFTAYYNDHAVEQADLTGELAAHWSKLEEYAARLALVFHFTRWAAHDPSLADEGKVDAESMEAGIALANWFGGEARRVYQMLDEDEAGSDRRRLIEWIGQHGGAVTARDVQQHCRWLKAPDAAETALETLAHVGIGQWEPSEPGQRGQPTRRFRLSTPSTVYGNSENADENSNNVDVDTVDAADEAPEAEVPTEPCSVPAATDSAAAKWEVWI